MSVWNLLDHFSPEEFAPHPEKMNEELLRRLNTARHFAGLPIYVTSHYRPGDPKAHGAGDAVDIADNLQGEPCTSTWRYHVLRSLLAAGFKRIGVYDRHIHADVSRTLPRGS